MESTSSDSATQARVESQPTLKVEVRVADGSSGWYRNQVRYGDLCAAITAAQSLYRRWTLCKDWRVVVVETGEVLAMRDPS